MSETFSDQKEYLELSSEEAKALACGDDGNDLFTVVSNEIWGEWRWGPELELIIEDIAGNYWRAYWRRQSDWEWSTFDDGHPIVFTRVVPRKKTVVEYVEA